MDAVTYPEKEVIDFINHFMIPLRINIKDLATQDKFKAIWTPTLAVLDFSGDEVQRNIGFFDSRELMASLHLGIAKVHLDEGENDTAEVHLKKLLDDFSDSSIVPEAIYFRGVNLYKWHHDPNNLKAAYEKLVDEYPDNTWTKRALPYRLIK